MLVCPTQGSFACLKIMRVLYFSKSVTCYALIQLCDSVTVWGGRQVNFLHNYLCICSGTMWEKYLSASDRMSRRSAVLKINRDTCGSVSRLLLWGDGSLPTTWPWLMRPSSDSGHQTVLTLQLRSFYYGFGFLKSTIHLHINCISLSISTKVTCWVTFDWECVEYADQIWGNCRCNNTEFSNPRIWDSFLSM